MRVLCIIISLLAISSISATELDSLIERGNRAYEDQDYELAITSYLQADSLIQSADLDLNLGNAYYKSGELGRAILHYERARKARPLDEDIQHNLQLARNLTLDKLEESTTSAFMLWWKGVLLKLGMDTLAWLSILAASISVLGWMYFRITRTRAKRQLGFTIGSVFIALMLLTIWMSLSAMRVMETKEDGIILSSRVEVLSAPDEESTELFILHEGSKVSLVEERGAWMNIALPNGNKGWMKSYEVEGI